MIQELLIECCILGVPDYCEKMHNVAKQFHQQTRQNKDLDETQKSRYDQISSALSNQKQKITA